MKKLISLLLSVCMVTTVLVGSVAAAPMEVQAESPAASSDLDRASGLVYGPWFGNGNESWNSNPIFGMAIAGWIFEGLTTVIPTAPARAASFTIGSALTNLSKTTQLAYTYGTVKKTYREVSYSDGSFAYFQSKFVINTTAVDEDGVEYRISPVTEYYEGSSPMRLDN